MKGPKRPHRENEIKIALPGASAGRRLLRGAGFRVAHPRVLESNIVFDTAGRSIIGAGGLLRLRVIKHRGILTYKGPASNGRRHKSREEIECSVDNPAALRSILERLGYQVIFRYEKFRSEFTLPGEPGIVMLDETPIGVYLEIEGPPRWVDRTARLLGFSPTDYITRSYGRLHFDRCAAEGIEPGDMLFP